MIPEEPRVDEKRASSPSGRYPVPFRGVIKVIHTREHSTLETVITYTVGRKRIRRDELVIIPPEKRNRGIICDLEADEVLLYRGKRGKKHFVRMTVPEFRKACEGTLKTADLPVGLFFVGLSSPYTSFTEPNAVTHDEFVCDRLTIKEWVKVYEVDHCRDIQVERELMELVEPNFPKEVTGFPIRRRTGVVVKEPTKKAEAAEKETDSKAMRYLKKGARAVKIVFEFVTQWQEQVSEVEARTARDADFERPAWFTELPSLDVFIKTFDPPKKRSDWDD